MTNGSIGFFTRIGHKYASQKTYGSKWEGRESIDRQKLTALETARR